MIEASSTGNLQVYGRGMEIAYGPEAFFQKYGGVSKYFLKLAEGFAEKGHDVKVVAPLFRTEGLRNLPRVRVEGTPLSHMLPGTRKILRTGSIIAGRAKVARRQPDIFHPTYYSLLDLVHSPVRKIVTVYDFVHEKVGGTGFIETGLTRWRKRAAINSADLVLSISRSTRDDLLDFFPRLDPQKVVVTPLGVDLKVADSPSAKVGLGRQTILWVGQRGRYKNFGVVAAALRFLPETSLHDIDLVLFGGEPLTTGEIEILVNSGLGPAQISQVFGDDRRLANCYSEARMLLYTSKYEGFGLPILEAMAAGCPVICSSSSSMPEVAGTAALLVDPGSPEEVGAAIHKLLENDYTYSRLKELGLQRATEFSWDRCVEETERAYLSVLK